MCISDWSSDVCSSDLVRMNAGAYGRDTSDILIEATVVTRDGAVETWPAARLGYTYRHSALPAGAVVVEALFAGVPGDKAVIAAEMDRIAAEREASQPLRSRTGGRSEEHTSELQSLMRISYAVFCFKKKKNIDEQKT